MHEKIRGEQQSGHIPAPAEKENVLRDSSRAGKSGTRSAVRNAGEKEFAARPQLFRQRCKRLDRTVAALQAVVGGDLKEHQLAGKDAEFRTLRLPERCRVRRADALSVDSGRQKEKTLLLRAVTADEILLLMRRDVEDPRGGVRRENPSFQSEKSPVARQKPEDRKRMFFPHLHGIAVVRREIEVTSGDPVEGDRGGKSLPFHGVGE